jgi:hypothetical protein
MINSDSSDATLVVEAMPEQENDTNKTVEYDLDRGTDSRIRLASVVPDGAGKCMEISEFHLKKGGWLKTFKFIRLTMQSYAALRLNLKDVSEALSDVHADKIVNLRIHIGYNIYMTVDSPYKGVNIRQWYRQTNGDDLRPGWGIFLKKKHWDELCDIDKTIENDVQELKLAEPCFHSGQLSWIACEACNPDKLYQECL